MNLDERLLRKLAEWRFDNERQSLTVAAPESAWTVAITADCADAVGCRLWEVAVKPTVAGPDFDLKARAKNIAGGVTGLLEPLKLVEVDVVRRTAQLRSEKPARRGDDILYYELLLEGNCAASVRRFSASALGKPGREQTAFTLTHEALAKLVADLTAS